MHRISILTVASSLLFAASALGFGDADCSGCATAVSNTHAASTASAVEAEPLTVRLGLGGYSPVSYLDRNKAEPGSPSIAAEYDGVTYFFTDSRQRRAFERNPERYLPAYGGYCAFGCSVDSRFVPDPKSFEVIDGRTHLFLKNAEVDARSLWNDADRRAVLAKADRFWQRQGESKAYIGGRNVPASGVALEGYSPVSYFTAGRPEQGDARYAVEHHGVTYHLTSPAQVELFKKNPDRYEPQCGGWCAFGMSVEDKFPVDPTKFKVVDGKLYLFLNNEQIDASELWEQGDDRELVGKAQRHWNAVSGS